jgi:ketosteroid isomerase-like protein
MCARCLVPACLLALIVSFAPPAKAQESQSDAATTQTLEAMEQEWLNAEKNHDAAAFEKLVADDWIAINPDGRSQTKAERAAAVKTTHIDSATLGNMNVRVFGESAVVTGTDDETATENGKKTTIHYAWMDVFVKRNGQWLAVASQTALVK